MNSQNICFKTDEKTGAIKELRITGDSTNMNWMLQTDGSQYPWVTKKYGWGLGYLTVNGKELSWLTPTKTTDNFQEVSYMAGDISIKVYRLPSGDGFSENYTFTNTGDTEARLTDIGIYTPFNDNYPDAETCMKARCHAHIWACDNATYVEMLRMRGRGDGIGLMVTDGKIADYEVWERSMENSYSNFRGVFALCPGDTVLKPGQSMNVAWKLFRHSGTQDFYNKLIKYGGAVASSPKYVYEVGETATVTLKTRNGNTTKEVKITRPGEIKTTIGYGNGKSTYATLLGISSYENLIKKRIDFILSHQQLKDASDPRNGAFMVYDNELEEIYKNDGTRQSDDTDEGRERVGMGILLAKWYMLHPDEQIKDALVRYASFVRTRLQNADYTVYHSAIAKEKERGYNYPWIADFYFRMYEITGNKQYAIDGYETMKTFFEHFGHGFYAINIPVLESLKVLEQAGMMDERASLLDDYKKTTATFMATGLDFPKHEVNYEQSIIAPATHFLIEMHIATGDKQCLDCVELMLEPLEAFASLQPTYHMNEISIRHWDGYWFGKSRMFGDTFPHYWSTINAAIYYYYAKCTGNHDYRHRAENIVRNNLCLFFEDGHASCAYLNPRRVNGKAAHFYDPFANDQDWALVFYLLVNHGI